MACGSCERDSARLAERLKGVVQLFIEVNLLYTAILACHYLNKALTRMLLCFTNTASQCEGVLWVAHVCRALCTEDRHTIKSKEWNERFIENL
jgi:hypothetical protein